MHKQAVCSLEPWQGTDTAYAGLTSAHLNHNQLSRDHLMVAILTASELADHDVSSALASTMAAQPSARATPSTSTCRLGRTGARVNQRGNVVYTYRNA